MADADLKIKIRADVQDVTKSLDKLEQEFNDLKKAVKNVSNQSDLDGLNMELAKTAANIKAIKNASAVGFGDAGKQLGSLAKGSGQATNALTNLNRVVQDAPFGIIGIANNIDPLVQSFQQLSASTGGPASALKALAGTLLGPAGILFAFSALSTTATVLIQKYGSLGAAFDALTGRTKTLSKEAQKFAKDQEQTAISIEKQRIETEQLVKVARGDIGSKAEQAAAIDRLNRAIPDYIGVLTEQNIKTGEGINIVKEYTKALQKQAVAQLYVNKGAELQVQQDTLRQNTTTELAQKFAEINRLRERIAKQLNVGGAFTGETGDEKRFKALQEEAKAIVAEFRDAYKEINKEKERIQKLIDANTVIIEPGQDGKKQAKPIKDNIDEISSILAEQNQKLREQIYNDIQANEKALDDYYNSFDRKESSPLQDLIDKGLFDSRQNGPVIETPGLIFKGDVEGQQNRINEQIKSIQQLKFTYDDVVKFLNQTVAPAFDNVFQSIFEGANVFKSLANSIKAVVAQLIAAAAKAAIFSAVINAIPGLGGGGFLKDFTKFLGFGNSLAPSGINAGSASLFSRAGGGQVEFVIQGQNLVGVLNRANNFRTING